MVFGGYSVNEKATPIYYDIMDNIQLGLQILFDEFNNKPRSVFSWTLLGIIVLILILFPK